MLIVLLYSVAFILLYLLFVNNGWSGFGNGKKIYVFLSSVLIISLYLLVDTKEFPDLPIYEDFYNSILVNGRVDHSADVLSFEKGYVLLNIIAHFISDNFKVIVFILSIFMVIALAQSSYKYSRIIWLTYILFICITFYSTIYILRQAFALIIIIHSLKYVIERNLNKFILCIVIAFFFHKSSIICLPLYVIYPFEVNFKTLTLVSLITIIFSLFFSYILTFFSVIFTDLADYISEDNDTISIVSLMIPFTSLIFSLICFKGGVQNYNRLFVWMGVIECVLTVLSFVVTEFGQFYRLILYFSVAKLFLLPNAIKAIRSFTIRSVTCFIWLICWLLYFNITSLYGFEF